jgi:hypothetical protein
MRTDKERRSTFIHPFRTNYKKEKERPEPKNVQ